MEAYTSDETLHSVLHSQKKPDLSKAQIKAVSTRLPRPISPLSGVSRVSLDHHLSLAESH